MGAATLECKDWGRKEKIRAEARRSKRTADRSGETVCCVDQVSTKWVKKVQKRVSYCERKGPENLVSWQSIHSERKSSGNRGSIYGEGSLTVSSIIPEVKVVNGSEIGIWGWERCGEFEPLSILW